MCTNQVVSLRDGIMPEVYAITAEHQRRIADPEDMPLDDTCEPLISCVAAVVAASAHLVSAITSDMFPSHEVHKIAITLATDAAEIARRVRPK